MKKANIIPEVVDFSNMSAHGRSRDFYKGTSFRWAHEWEPGKHYANDTYFVDFVSYEGCIYVCTESHYSAESVRPGASDYWEIAIENKLIPEDLWNSAFEEVNQKIDSIITSIDDLESVVNTKVDAEVVYTKEEADQLLDKKANKATTLAGYGITDTYTKDQIDDMFSDGSFDVDLSDYYTKTQVEQYITSQNFLTEIPEEYVTDSEINSAINESTTITTIQNDIKELQELSIGTIDGTELDSWNVPED